jgi:hypothetical protein
MCGGTEESFSLLTAITFTNLFRREAKKSTIVLLRYSVYNLDSFWYVSVKWIIFPMISAKVLSYVPNESTS